MNATAWMLLGVTMFVAGWAVWCILFLPTRLTVSATLRSGGPWLALALIVGFGVLVWHIWIQGNNDWPWGAAK